jgi:hypothetical protein
LQLG